jgi:hypothetical protein
MMFHGLGASPTDSYYDPNRPAWMPYWLDDPTEIAQKYGMYGNANVNTVYPNPPAPVPPVVQPDLTGQTVSIDQQIADTAAANKAQTQTFFDNLANTLPNSPTPPTAPSPFNGVTLLYIALAVGAVMVISKRK